MSQEGIDEFADLWALMYCVMAREMVDSFGEEGKEALIRAIQNYGKAGVNASRQDTKRKEEKSTSEASSTTMTYLVTVRQRRIGLSIRMIS